MSWDDTFSYSTVKTVTIRDRYLGILHYSLMTVLFLYIVVYVLIVQQKYYAVDTNTGDVATKVKGQAYANSSTGEAVTYDFVDAVRPYLEPKALFLVTHTQTTRAQAQGTCNDWTAPCTAANASVACANADHSLDHYSPPTCNLPKGYCSRRQWCPAENLSPALGPVTTTDEALDGVQWFTIWLKATITFPRWSPPGFFTTMKTEDPVFFNGTNGNDPTVNTYTLEQLLEATGYSYHDIRKTGAILHATLYWNCYSNKLCNPRLDVERLDDPGGNKATGFNVRTAVYDYSTSEPTRTLTKLFGVRIFFSSVGTGFQPSLVQIILQLSSGAALMGVATLLTDLVMQRIMPQRKHYYAYKNETSEDFSDLRAHLLGDELDAPSPLSAKYGATINTQQQPLPTF